MKRYVVGALIGAILVFGWQSAAHMVMTHHKPAYKQVENQDEVIKTLSGIFKEEGQYLVPISNPNATQEEEAKFNEDMAGKPFAQVVYHKAWDNDMGKAAMLGFLTAFVCVFILIVVLGPGQGGFAAVFFKSMLAGLFSFLFIWYNQHIWMQLPWQAIQGELIDCIVAWGLCGLWLGWWLNKVPAKPAS